MNKIEKTKYFQGFQRVLNSPEWKFDMKLNSADLEFTLDYFISRRPLGECKAKLKRQFKIDDVTATKIISKLCRTFEGIENSIK